MRRFSISYHFAKIKNFLKTSPKGEGFSPRLRNKIGGVWKGGKIGGFEFKKDPTDLFNDVKNGVKRNLQKESQSYFTPDELADTVVKLAELKKTDLILEPSAGRGAIVNAVNRVLTNKEVYCCELNESNREYLKVMQTVRLLNEDFLVPDINKLNFDKIIANPPFSKNQDIIHVKEMYTCLRSGGRLVSIVSKHWKTSKNKLETDFRDWFKSVNGVEKEVPAGSFKKSGTMVDTLILIIDKK